MSPTNPAALEPALTAVFTRFLRQNDVEPEAELVREFVGRLQQLVADYGLPAITDNEAQSLETRLSDKECNARAAFVAGTDAAPIVAEAAKQLVKTLFYPELKVCRSSFEAVTGDGACRRQELERVRRRVSGTHCVDCPHWRDWDAQGHIQYLQPRWLASSDNFTANRDIFLPEDFRVLRAAIARQRDAG